MLRIDLELSVKHAIIIIRIYAFTSANYGNSTDMCAKLLSMILSTCILRLKSYETYQSVLLQCSAQREVARGHVQSTAEKLDQNRSRNPY